MKTQFDQHFSNIAKHYNILRSTDQTPITFIQKKLKDLPKINAVDVGCGPGRYSLELLRHLGERLQLLCIDANDHMIEELRSNLLAEGFTHFKTATALANNLPVMSLSLDALFSFNAIHHFELESFFKETARTLKPYAHAFLYTRTRHQNRRILWGRYFPDFAQKEKRLLELDELKVCLDKNADLKLSSVEVFRFKKTSDLASILNQAKNYHYSTFCLYETREFEENLKYFEKKIRQNFSDLKRITWEDENTMLVLEKLLPHNRINP